MESSDSRPSAAALAAIQKPGFQLAFAALILLVQAVGTWQATRHDRLYSDEVFHAPQAERFCKGEVEETPPTPQQEAKAEKLRKRSMKDPKLRRRLKHQRRIQKFFAKHPYALHKAITT